MESATCRDILIQNSPKTTKKLFTFWRFDLCQRPLSEEAGTRSSSSGSWRDKYESSQESGRMYDWVGSSLRPGSWIVDLPSGYVGILFANDHTPLLRSAMDVLHSKSKKWGLSIAWLCFRWVRVHGITVDCLWDQDVICTGRAKTGPADVL